MLARTTFTRSLSATIAALAIVPLTPLSAQMLLSDKYGGPMSIVPVPEAYQQPEDVRERFLLYKGEAPRIAEEFHRFCVETGFDKDAFEQAVLTEGSLYKAKTITLEAKRKWPEVSFEVFRKQSAMASMWLGEHAEELKGRFQFSRSRGALITGPFKAKNVPSPQCNLSYRTQNLKSGDALAETLTSLLGKEPDKLVLKKGFADGYWTWPMDDGSTRRVTFSIVDLKKFSQLVHVTHQIIQPKKKKRR